LSSLSLKAYYQYGIDIPNIKWIIQYQAMKELSTFWQGAGHAGCNLAIDAVAILLTEACFFDDEKDKAAQKAVE